LKSAFEFNGANSYIEINHDDSLNASIEGFSISFWIKAASKSNDDWITIISKSADSKGNS